MELSVYNIEGQETSKKVTLDDTVFGIEPNNHAIYLDVKQLQANRRQGTHKSKQRGEVRYSTRKLKKQKGTGGARAGSIKSPLFVGGGRVFGPVPRDYSHKLNKKQKNLARRSALSQKALDSSIRIVENITLEAPKTKDFLKICENQQLNGKKLLIVLPEPNKNVYLSSRNLPNAKTIIASDINTYDIMNANNVLFFEGAVDVVNQLLGAEISELAAENNTETVENQVVVNELQPQESGQVNSEQENTQQSNSEQESSKQENSEQSNGEQENSEQSNGEQENSQQSDSEQESSEQNNSEQENSEQK
jgi:large subunit ribosomal protein L4